MSNQVIYIEDQADTRDTFVRSLRRVYGNEYEIIAPEPKPRIEDMIKHLFSYDSPVAFILDEKLQLTGETSYLGSELAEEIRVIDNKIPIYILTSFSGDVDHISGNIEFVIDKNTLSDSKERDKLSQRMRRHQSTFADIKSERAERLDFLLQKSIESSLTDDEHKEYEQLNFFRLKPILIDEGIPSESMEIELKRQEELIELISEDLEKIKRID